MESLKRIVESPAVVVPEFTLDRYQEAVLEQLHLEFFLASCRVIITPDFGHIETGDALDSEIEEVEDLLAQQRRALTRWRRYIVCNLALYSALLETNSYYLDMNDNLLICRFVSWRHDPDQLIIKLYTIAEDDLPDHYADKLYLGRDQISLQSLKRPHFGLENIRRSVIEQFDKLGGRIAKLVPEGEDRESYHIWLADMSETIDELSRETDELQGAFPAEVFMHDLKTDTLLDASSHFRSIKHVLIELEASARELERLLRDNGHDKAAGYTTKFAKDIVNDINFLMCKVNGRISNVVNQIDALAFFHHPTES